LATGKQQHKPAAYATHRVLQRAHLICIITCAMHSTTNIKIAQTIDLETIRHDGREAHDVNHVWRTQVEMRMKHMVPAMRTVNLKVRRHTGAHAVERFKTHSAYVVSYLPARVSTALPYCSRKNVSYHRKCPAHKRTVYHHMS